MVRGAPEHECMWEKPKRKRQKQVETTPSTLNSNASATLGNSGIPEQNVPCGTSGRGDAEALDRNSRAADSTRGKLHNTSQGSAEHAD